MSMRWVLACWAVLGLASGLVAQEKPVPTYHRDQVVGKAGETELKLDLAVPSVGKGPFPVIVCVHGGGWRAGSYKDPVFQNLMKTFAEHGFASASIQYRLAPKFQFPHQIEDCKCAVRWLRVNAAKFNLDPERFGAIGGSAGGHLVCLLGLTTKDDGLEGTSDLTPEAARQSSRVSCVVNLFGPTDFLNRDWQPNVESLMVGFLGGPLEERRDEYRRAAPLTYVRKDPPPPPMLIFHGTKDNIVPYIHATKLRDALQKVGGDVKLVTMEGDGHGWGGDKLHRTVDETMAFFKKHLGSADNRAK